MRSRYEDPEEKKKREQDEAREAIRQAGLRRDCQTLLAMPEFQRVMSEFLSMGSIMRTVMTGNAFTYSQAGKQDYAREMFNFMVKVDRDAAFDLLKTQIDPESSINKE